MRPAALAATALVLLPTAARAEWKLLAFPRADVTLRAVAMTGPRGFRVSGSKGTYGVSDDGGRTWRLVATPAGESLDFRGLAALSLTESVLMSAGDGPAGQARLYRTADAGRTWTLAFETKQAGAFFDAVAFRDRRHGLVMGDPIDGRWFLLETRDGGKRWAPLAAKLPPMQTGEAAFAASNSALFLGGRADAWIVSGGAGRGRAFRSKDGGRSWTVAETPIAGGSNGGLFGGLALGDGRAVIVGGDHKDEARAAPNIAVSHGDGWALAQQQPAGLLEAVGRLDARTLLAVGPRGTAMSADNGKSWRTLDAEAFHAIACKRGTCVAAGARGRVAVWVR